MDNKRFYSNGLSVLIRQQEKRALQGQHVLVLLVFVRLTTQKPRHANVNNYYVACTSSTVSASPDADVRFSLSKSTACSGSSFGAGLGGTHSMTLHRQSRLLEASVLRVCSL